MATGLDTGLNPTFGIKNAMYGPNNFKGFQTSVEKNLLREDLRCRRFELPENKTR